MTGRSSDVCDVAERHFAVADVVVAIVAVSPAAAAAGDDDDAFAIARPHLDAPT